jgi:hypothetical protein
MKTEAASSRGGLFMRVDRDETHMHLTLTCATHWRDWKDARSVGVDELRRAARLVLVPGNRETPRSDRGATLLALVCDEMVRAARHSLKTCACACASPLFDSE